jgi:hypothetical protein
LQSAQLAVGNEYVKTALGFLRRHAFAAVGQFDGQLAHVVFI